MKKRHILSLMLLLSGALSAQDLHLSESVTLRYSGSLGAEAWNFPKKAPVPGFPEYVTTAMGQLDLKLLFDRPMEIRLNQRVQFDPDNEDRNRYEIDDLYIDYFGDRFEIRAGLQIFSWKTVESISFADFLNQTDIESDLLDAPKRSELAVRLRYIAYTNVEHVFELYFLPYMRPTRFPVGDNRFSFGLPVSNDSDDHLYQDDGEAWRPQIALSYQRWLFESVDARFFYFNGYNRFPGLVPSQGFNFEIFHQYRPVHKAGTAFQGEIGPWLVKGEMVYTDYLKKVTNQLGQRIQPRFFAYTLGFEYTFYSPVIQNHDLGTIIEIIGDTDSGKKPEELESFRPFPNHLFGGMRYTFNNISDRSILVGGFYNYRDGDVLLSAEYSERLFERFTAKIEYNALQSNTDPLSQFEHTDRVIVQVLYNF